MNCGLPVIATNVGAPDPVHSPTRSLKLVDNGASGVTPQAYLCHVYPLTDGDVVTACIWIYDVTPGSAPSGRIWANYTDIGGDCETYAGSASGNYDYGPGTGWDEPCHDWVVADGHTGLVIEVRTYSSPGDVVWIDELEVTAPDHAEIITPETEVTVDSATWSAIKGLYR